MIDSSSSRRRPFFFSSRRIAPFALAPQLASSCIAANTLFESNSRLWMSRVDACDGLRGRIAAAHASATHQNHAADSNNNTQSVWKSLELEGDHASRCCNRSRCDVHFFPAAALAACTALVAASSAALAFASSLAILYSMALRMLRSTACSRAWSDESRPGRPD